MTKIYNYSRREVLKNCVKKIGIYGSLTIAELREFLFMTRKWKPKKDEGHYMVRLELGNLTSFNTWDGDDYDRRRLARGLIFRTEQEAVDAAKYLLKKLKQYKNGKK